ncbi:MAG: DUF3887 domain-containing protein [FCB group bacterium]|jgi:hypothetical protein|nr:DUF3887 domain-containing protein [FCB group bacterium]
MYRVVALLLCVTMLAAAGCGAKETPPADNAQTSEAPPATATPAADPQVIAKDLVTALAAGDTAKATSNFDAKMASAMPASQLAEVWAQVTSQFGAFKTQLGTRTEKIQGYNVVLVNCEFERATLDIQVTVDDAGKVSGLFVRPSQG